MSAGILISKNSLVAPLFFNLMGGIR